jgi:phosphoserine aminotransferase
MNPPKINFTPGPSQLYFTVQDHARTAFRKGIPSLSHRSKSFEGIFENAVTGLRQLLNIPAGFHVFFTGSATEIWERSIQNLVASHSLHLVNGAFSKRYYETALQLGRNARSIEARDGDGFSDLASMVEEPELIAVTHNETSTGVSLPLSFIHSLKDRYPNAIIAVDAVSSLPFPDFDYDRVDTVFFSVQKGFGLPAGLGVWLVNNRCIEKANTLLAQGVSIGSYHTLPSLFAHGQKSQTPETPNVLGIYLLARVVDDMLRVGISKIRNDTTYKAAILYQALEQHALLQPFVSDEVYRSQTVIVVASGSHTDSLNSRLLAMGMQPGDGYGQARKMQLRFANFPTHAREHFEHLVDAIASFTG